MRSLTGTLLAGLLAFAVCAPLYGQVKPLPRNPLESPPAPAQPGTPREPGGTMTPRDNPAPNLPGPPTRLERGPQPNAHALRGVSLPVIEMVNSHEPRIPGEVTSLNIRVSNLGNARAMHLLVLDLGCSIDVHPGSRGHQLFMHGLSFRPIDNRPRLTSDRGSPVRGQYEYSGSQQLSITLRDLEGVPVARDGSVTFRLSGVVGVTPFFAQDIVEFPGLYNGAYSGPAGFGHQIYLRQIQPVGAADSTCTPSAVVAMKDPAGRWFTYDDQGGRLELPGVFQRQTLDSRMPLVIKGRPWFMAAVRRVTIENTWQLGELLAPRITSLGTGSTCARQSVTPFGSFPVGLVERDRDLAFVIRSGPAGTRCQFDLPPRLLPQGVVLESTEFTVTHVGDQCRIEDEAAILYSRGALHDPSDPVTELPRIISGQGKFGGSTLSWLNPFAKPEAGAAYRWGRWASPLVTVLDCRPTLVNDHEVAVSMRRATFLVAEGVRFP
jgi:hypothetical protein